MRDIKLHLLISAFVFPLSAIAQDEGMNHSVEFGRTTLELKQVFDTIEKQTALHFSYDPQVIQPDTKIKLGENNLTTGKIFDLLHNTYGLSIVRQGNVIIVQRPKKKRPALVTISGTVRDEATGELLAGAQIVLPGSLGGATANQYGFYSLSRSTGVNEKVEARFLGYWPSRFQFHFNQDTTADISLIPKAILLQDVIVTASEFENPKDIQIGSGGFTVSARKIKETTSFGGEPDALKTLQFLPGIQSGNEGTTNLSIRGGSPDQNLYLLDEAPVYNPSHALSFFSIFNSDAIQSVTLYKSAIPVIYGGRLSSVVDVRMKEGNRVKRAYSGSIGTIASRFTVEGPVSKENDKASFIVSGRYGYAGHVVNGVYFLGSNIFSDPTANNSTKDNKIGFYDLNAKVNFRKSEKDHFYFSAYAGHDNFYFNHITNNYALAWGNHTGTFRWNHIHTSRLFSNTTASFSNYNYEYRLLNNTQYFLWSAGFKELDIKQDYDFYVNNNNHIIFGWGIEGHWINPGRVDPRSEQAVTRTYSLQKQYPVGTYLYIGNEQAIGKRIKITYGLRYSNFIVTGPGIRYRFQVGDDQPYDSVQYSRRDVETVYQHVDPRLSINYTEGKHTLTASYDRTTQYLHLLANSSVGLPTDIWMPSGGSIEPQNADIYSINYLRNISMEIEGSVGAFYKHFNNILDFKDNANLFVNRYVESQLLQGTGEAYGAEFFVQKTSGNFTGSASYTWSKAINRIAGVNGNKPFPTRYDKRHNLSITGKMNLSKRWETSFSFVYTTGGALTVPVGNFTYNGVVFNDYSSRNAYRFPDYHRLDLSFRYHSKKNDKQRFKRYWSFDVYNVYGRKNPFTIYSQQQDHGFMQTEMKAIYLFKMVPSISYNFTF